MVQFSTTNDEAARNLSAAGKRSIWKFYNNRKVSHAGPLQWIKMQGRHTLEIRLRDSRHFWVPQLLQLVLVKDTRRPMWSIGIMKKMHKNPSPIIRTNFQWELLASQLLWNRWYTIFAQGTTKLLFWHLLSWRLMWLCLKISSAWPCYFELNYVTIKVFSNTACIKLVPPRAANLCIHFVNKEIISVEDLMKYAEIEREKSPAPGGNQTHNLLSFCSHGVRSTAVLLLLPI